MKEGELQRETLELGGFEDGDDDIKDELWRTLVADRGPDGGTPPIWYRLAMLHCIEKRNNTGDLYPTRLSTYETSSSMREFLQRMSNVLWERILIRSKVHNHLGHAPRYAQKDDLICILLGCSVPVILRQTAPVGQNQSEQSLMDIQDGDASTVKEDIWSCEFIGEAYIYGMMDGEYLTQLECPDLDSTSLSQHPDAKVFRLR